MEYHDRAYSFGIQQRLLDDRVLGIGRFDYTILITNQQGSDHVMFRSETFTMVAQRRFAGEN